MPARQLKIPIVIIMIITACALVVLAADLANSNIGVIMVR